MKDWSLGIILMFCAGGLNAQEKFGSVHSNYTPTNSVHLNPSSMLDAKTWLDIHVVGLGSYFNNSFAAIENRSWINVLTQQNVDVSQLLYRTNRNNYHAYSRNDVSALSAVLSQGDHAFGLSFNGFAYLDVRRLDNTIAEPLSRIFQNENVTDFTNLDVNRLRLNAISYGEVKLSYAYTFRKIYKDMLMFGVSVKKIFPLAGGAVKISEANYNFETNNLLSINSLQADAMLSQSGEFLLLGGEGIDLGFTYQKMKDRPSTYFPNSTKSGCRPKFYKYKIGVSLVDFGAIRFRRSSTDAYAIALTDTVRISIDSNSTVESTVGTINTGDEAATINRPNKMSLSTVFSFQFDYNVWNNMFYVNATVVQGVPPFSGSYGVRRANSLSITPRLETKWFDVAIPFSLYEYRTPQLGFSMRIRSLTIGTDKLLGIVLPSDLYGADIYAQLKVPIFKNPKCKDRGVNSKKSRRKRKKLCEAYW